MQYAPLGTTQCGGRGPAARASLCPGTAPAPARAAAHVAQTRAPTGGAQLQATSSPYGPRAPPAALL
eukprot:3474291-Prymnesium_polylepis.1